jgi:plasmid stability protein
MANISVRNIPDHVIEALKDDARAHSRSLEAEVRAILERNSKVSKEEFWRVMDEIAESTRGRWTGDVVQMIREDRDR